MNPTNNKPTNSEYLEMTKKYSPNSKIFSNCLKAFVVGGLICVLGQFLLNTYLGFGFDKKDAGAWVSVTLVVISATLTGFGLYDDIAKHAGAGSLVPITGFANAIVAPALEFKSEGLILGLAAKLFVVAGPVITYGISSSIIYGLIIYLFKLY